MPSYHCPMCRARVFRQDSDICPHCLKSGKTVRMDLVPAENGEHPYIVKHPERVQSEVMAELRTD